MHADVLNMHILNSVACLLTHHFHYFNNFPLENLFDKPIKQTPIWWTCFGKIALTIVGTENTTNPAILGLNHLTYCDTITSVLHNFKNRHAQNPAILGLTGNHLTYFDTHMYYTILKKLPCT